ncbi:uncharacterized protein LACBIDRAFT_299600 [Laccaria bicolor S238N-H82]|uniref:F-box domain-containing protein n=1 Tax=Laccaria bicolor (strain S238N-H82 / ATCC MYA-4686) TaxID=486041 RepID=B0DEY4_LACBS|nr:uncharacterized protein LACBIDRAFT_299600 [Laccaria bicolor S238N-H82]EDR06752.1 hypothetical protein LACBIDRAFT_299600 [Laccaria bicolor S238N-H82]|eukprot:XP_001882599.1 hypothetical protein LACBIDRAFT_299600 [Laccaria bicolor S238N-H82]
MRDIPYDVWLCIVQFIPRNELLRLYGVDRILFDIVMNERYRETRIYHLGDEMTRQCLVGLGSPDIARRVRTLHLRPHLFGKPLAFHGQKKSLSQSLLRKLSKEEKQSAATAKASVQLLRSITNLTNLVTLNLECQNYPVDDYNDFKLAIPFITNGWLAYGSVLRTLSLKIPLEACKECLPPSLRLPSLEDLSIHIFTAYLTTDATKLVRSVLVPFVNRHSLTIESLTISTPMAFNYNISPMFGELEYLPRLTKIDVYFPLISLQQTDSAGLHHLLKAQSGNLLTLRIRFGHLFGLTTQPPAPCALFAHPMFKVSLPNLKSLELNILGHNTRLVQCVVPYLHQFRDSLTTLVLNHHQATHLEAYDIIDVFERSSSRLLLLDLWLTHLSPSFLDVLSVKLPDLERLNLSFGTFVGHDHTFSMTRSYSHRHIPIQEFCSEMPNHVYTDWKLKHLKIGNVGYCAGILAQCETALAMSLPGVKTFDGLSRRDYLAKWDQVYCKVV